MINQIEHNEVKSSQISENEVVGSKDSSGTIIHKDNSINSMKSNLFWRNQLIDEAKTNAAQQN